MTTPPTTGLPSGTITFLFTDIEASTSLAARLGRRYAQVLHDHHRLLRAAFLSAGGCEVDSQGDGFLVAFRRARDALAAAVSAQRAIGNHQWPNSVHVKVRMGIHTGEPMASDGRYVGLVVHRAARICAAAHGGQVVLSGATYAVLADYALQEIDLRDLGQHRLESLARPEQIYQLVAPGLEESFPPLRTKSPTRGARAVPAAGPPLRVVVADDSALIRDGVSLLLESAGFDVVARAGDADGLLREVDRTRPDVAVTDVRMPHTHVDEGLAAAAGIRRDHPDVGVIVLSQYLDTGYATHVLEQYPERVGYLLKDRVYDIATLADAIRRVAEGECVLDPTIAAKLKAPGPR
jgi:class 3 adenylate cyclase/CheY-like chemotaxis protein